MIACACNYPGRQMPAAWTRVDPDAPAHEPDVPYEPSSDRAIATMIELGQPGPSDVVFDLGCGDGRVVIEAVRKTGARGVCIDIDPKLVRQARENAAHAGVAQRIEFRVEDLFASDLRSATVVMLFLWPEINRRLLPKLRRDLPPGARIVSNMHDMGDFEPTRIAHIGSVNGQPHNVYLWQLPP